MLEMLHAADLAQCKRALNGEPKLISRVTVPELILKASRARAGVFDFDGTLTTASQWNEVAKLMPDDLREADRAFIDWYMSHHWDRNLPDTTIEDPDWFLSHLLEPNRPAAEGASVSRFIGFCRQSRITYADLKLVGEGLPARDWAVELMGMFKPNLIVSYGIEAVIEAFCRARGLDAKVVANRFLFDDSGVVIDGHFNVVVSSTKPLAVQRFRALTGIKPEETLTLGDSIVDIDMMDNSGLNILLIPYSEGDAKLREFREANLGAAWRRVTAILHDDSLYGLACLIQESRQTYCTEP